MVDQIPQTIPSSAVPPQGAQSQAVPQQVNTSIPPQGTPPPVPQFPFQQAPVQVPPVRPQQTANITKPTSKISIRTVLV
ncbi:MAG: hypothetical protein WCL02_01825 [bacterium]